MLEDAGKWCVDTSVDAAGRSAGATHERRVGGKWRLYVERVL
jgi:hypothetical protein